jgi:hypothetical protein
MRANTCVTPMATLPMASGREDAGQVEDLRGILLLDGIEDRPVPDIDAVLKGDLQNDQREQPDGEDPCEPAAA